MATGPNACGFARGGKLFASVVAERRHQVVARVPGCRERSRAYDRQRFRDDGGTLVGSDALQCDWGEGRGFAAGVPKVLLEASVIHFAFKRPDGRKDLLLVRLLGEFHTAVIRPVTLRKRNQELVLVHRYAAA